MLTQTYATVVSEIGSRKRLGPVELNHQALLPDYLISEVAEKMSQLRCQS